MAEFTADERYTYEVAWSEEDEEFVGTCLELPSLSWLAPDRSAALEGIVSLAGEVVADLLDAGEEVPEPLSLRHYSGKFQLRTSPQLHASLVREALRDGISLNALANVKLARG